METQSQEYHSVDWVEIGRLGRKQLLVVCFQGQEKAVVNQTQIKTFKSRIEESAERGWNAYAGFSKC